MIATSDSADASPLRPVLDRVVWPGSVVLFGVLPVIVVVLLFASAIQDDTVALDFRQFYRAAERILEGQSPYVAGPEAVTPWGGPFPYPPLPAFVAAPLTVLPLEAAGLLMMAALVGAALATLAVLGVRDWRLYGLVLLWPPVLSAVQTGNLTLLLGLAAAVAWRFRARTGIGPVAIGVTLAAKFFLWPLVVWLAATRRVAGAVLATAVGAVLLFVSWTVIGFEGFRDYPDLLRRLEETVGADSYTVYIVALDAGAPPGFARALWLAVGLGLLAATVLAARRGDDRSAFVLALAASLALTPIVWLHYFALLVVVAAVAQPRLGAVWFVPFAMVLTPGSGQPTPFETAWTLAATALTVVLALRAIRSRPPLAHFPTRAAPTTEP